jgi:hypothetical protein
MTVLAGVASIKGVYQGEVRLGSQQPPDSFVLKAAGSGAPGTVSADVLVTLAEASPSSTTLTYDADAIVGGMIGGVGQRMLTGVAKKTAGEFFAAVDDVLTGKAPTPAAVAGDGTAAAGAGAAPATTGAPATTTATPGVFEAPGAGRALAGAGLGGPFVQGAVVGAAAALVGALIGGWIAGRRRA